ncbi:MAG: hypothetical protein RML35_12070 [Chloroherpetonaceae bacterium]|nr:hypothetical protein [Chloroherpetonaceae bacterium]
MVENPQLSQAGVQAQYNQHIQEGLRKSKLWEQFMTGIPNTKKGLYLRSMSGHLYDNLASMLQVTPKMVTEQTNTSQIGSFINYGFPMIRSIIPHLNAINLVTTQVLPAPQGFIFHLDYRRGTNKGRIRKGTSLFETLPNLMENSGANYNENVTYNGFEDYASENVPGQFLGTVPVQVSTVGGTRVVALTGTRTFSTSLEFLPIRPRTLKIYLAFPNDAQNRLLIAEDVDGTGVLTSTITNLVNNASVQYGSGLLQFTINASINFPARLGTREVPDATSELRVEVDWRYVSEGSNNIPEVDILVNSAPVHD